MDRDARYSVDDGSNENVFEGKKTWPLKTNCSSLNNMSKLSKPIRKIAGQNTVPSSENIFFPLNFSSQFIKNTWNIKHFRLKSSAKRSGFVRIKFVYFNCSAINSHPYQSLCCRKTLFSFNLFCNSWWNVSARRLKSILSLTVSYEVKL